MLVFRKARDGKDATTITFDEFMDGERGKDRDALSFHARIQRADDLSLSPANALQLTNIEISIGAFHLPCFVHARLQHLTLVDFPLLI